MSQLTIRNSLLTKAIDTIVTGLGLELAYENKDFEPTGLDSWCDFAFIPATSESCGKSSGSSDDDRGFIQIGVYVKTNAPDYDNEQLAIIDSIKSAFYYGLKVDDVSILEVTTANGFNVESWFKRPMTINYSAFSSRV